MGEGLPGSFVTDGGCHELLRRDAQLVEGQWPFGPVHREKVLSDISKAKEEAVAFTHLHVHTEYSLLDGSSKIREIVARAKELGMDSLAITDHGAMYGVIDFYKAAKEAGIRPILGCEVYVTPGSRFDRETVRGEDRYYHLILLAENDTGYANLTKIVSRGFVDGFYYKPRVDYATLEEYHEGIIACSACLAGEVARNLARNQYEEAKQAALRYQEIFGRGNFFLELQDHGIMQQKLVNQQLLQLSGDTGIELIASNDSHYTYAEDAEPHDLLLCLQTGKKVTDTDRMRYEGGQYYLKSEEEMRALFPYAPEALDNTQKIAERCEVNIRFHELKLPAYEVPEGYQDAWDYLKALCEKGFKERYPEAEPSVRERMQEELQVIHRMGYVDYFLIVWDYINYAKSHGIAVGPGRGSAAGSVVSYCLGITDIEPIRYQLIFERFLNPERVSMPDIDVDFAYERRQEVIDYVGRKYGADRVVQIITFGTLAAKGVVRDVGRVLDLPYARCDAIAKMIPMELGMTLDKALKVSRELRAAYDTDPEVKRLIDLSRRLEGLPRHASMHAAGVVISKESANEYVPLSRAADGSLTTQFTMTTLEELGLLKMDFLGLRTLTVIQNAAKAAEKKAGHPIDMLKIDFNDPRVMEMIGTGSTEGVFQLESSGMKSFMKELKPATLEDIIAGISLYRPGPMDFIPRYLKGKNDQSAIRYECPQLEPILKPTYGCIVYQEQVMQIVRDLAGYTWGRSDLVRRAMSKKKEAVMQKERQNFVYGNPEEQVKGCVANGIPEETANHIFDEMIDFAKYAFNKSHAACYAYVSFQTAWLKYYYPKEFMAALMTSVLDNSGKVAEYILSCRQMGIAILPPDVNEGESGFSVSGEGIRFGLSAIRSVGAAVSDEIIRERESGGIFRSLEDFVDRLSNKEVNRRTLESFVKSGALDSMPGNRKQKLLIVPELLERKSKKKDSVTGQLTLFDFASEEDKDSFRISFPETEEFDKEELLRFEKETLGIYLSGHPLESCLELWESTVTAKTTDFTVDQENGCARVRDGARVTIGGLIADKSLKTTKNNQTMAFVTVEDMVGSVEVLLFPRDYEKYKSLLIPEGKVFLQGRVTIGDEDIAGKLICERMYLFERRETTLWIQYENRSAYDKDIARLMMDLGNSEGDAEVKIYLREEKQMRTLGENWKVSTDEALLQRLGARLGAENVKTVTRALK